MLPLQSVRPKRWAHAALQRWHQLLLYKREAYPQMLSSYLQAWATYAQRVPLLRFLLLEHKAIRQVRTQHFQCERHAQGCTIAAGHVLAQAARSYGCLSASLGSMSCLTCQASCPQARQKAVVFSTWSDMTASSRAISQHDAALSLTCSVSQVRTFWPEEGSADKNWKRRQTAFQGWRAVVLHMAARRQQLQQAALASAERAIRKGCDAASESTVVRHGGQNNTTPTEQPQLSLLEPQNRRHGCIQLQHQLSSQNSADLTAAFLKASAHWSEQLQAKVLQAWQQISRHAIANLWQQHELKSLVNQQLLQVNKSEPSVLCILAYMFDFSITKARSWHGFVRSYDSYSRQSIIWC